MNDFEDELKKQPIRRVPEHWRAQILREAGSRERSAPNGCHNEPWWAALLWPSPKAWGALAATWVVMIGFSVANRESGAREEGPQPAQIRMVMEEKRRLQADVEEASLHLEQQPKPRSERSAETKSV
ncbi:MAG TPA: hypothetical protein VK850_16465 [Candidatus Binatia bacterium]|nr:hypothetical protein [Candidatus Binatia bacterium]